MDTKKPIITPAETKEYLSSNGIPQLFECLMTGLMYHRPKDHLNYLQECLEKIKQQGVAGVRWDLFLETRSTTPPRMAGKKGQLNLSKYEPLPGVDSMKVRIRSNASIICVLGGPGVDKTSYSLKLINHYPTFVHLSMGDLLRNRAKLEAQRKGSRWQNSVDKINAGELLPQEMVLESLIWNLNQHADASGFIIDGFPRTPQQYEELKNHIGLDNLACVFLIDAVEEFCKQKLTERGQTDEFWQDHLPAAMENRICLFKLQTLPMCKNVDNDGKLRVVDGEIKPEHILRDMRTVCEYVLSGKVTGPTTRPTPGSVHDRPPDKVSHGMVGCPGQPPVFNIPRIVPTVADTGRVADLPICPVILLFGGPGSGRSEQAIALCERLPGLKHFNVTDFLRNRVLDRIEGDSQKDWDVVARRVHSSDPPMVKDRIVPEYWDVQVDILRQEFNTVANNTRAVVIEGYPNDEHQLNIFNQHIGGADLAILLDCEENTLQKRLLKRYARLSRVEDEEIVSLHRILFFKHCTLPVIRHYDERSILVTIPADREASLVLNDVVTVVEYFLGKQESQNNNSAAPIIGSRSPSITQINNSRNPSLSTIDKILFFEESEIQPTALDTEEAVPPPESVTDKQDSVLSESVHESGRRPSKVDSHDPESVDHMLDPSEYEVESEIHPLTVGPVKTGGSMDSESEKDSAEHPSDTVDESRIIFIVGEPNSGKTTLGRKLAEHLGYSYCSYAEFQTKTLTVKDIINKAILAEERVFKGMVLDDFPATADGHLNTTDKLPTNRIVLALKKTIERTSASEIFDDSTDPKSENVKNGDRKESISSSGPEEKYVYQIDVSHSLDETFEEICAILDKYQVN